jgi:hypothetical protein
LDGSFTRGHHFPTPDFCIAGRSSLLADLEISKKEWLVVKMKAFFSGCFGFVAIIFALGFITSAAGQVLSFYFGSSQGSKDKTEEIKGMLKK